MAELGTAELVIEPKMGEGFAELEAIATVSQRQVALDFAIRSVQAFENPPAPEHIVDRAEVFHAFLSADDD